MFRCGLFVLLHLLSTSCAVRDEDNTIITPSIVRRLVQDMGRVMEDSKVLLSVVENLTTKVNQLQSQLEEGFQLVERSNANVRSQISETKYHLEAEMQSKISNTSRHLQSIITDVCIKVPVNLAKGKSTKQSSTYPGGPSEHVTDGDINQHWSGNTCSHTAADTNPFWRVDLGALYKIGSVKIYNRESWGNRLHDFFIGVTSDDFAIAPEPGSYPLCNAQYKGAATNGQVLDIKCNSGVKGRYVWIQVPGNKQMLTLCEVQVFEAV